MEKYDILDVIEWCRMKVSKGENAMMELSCDSFRVRCRRCHEVITVFADELEVEVSSYDHGENGMGDETIYDIRELALINLGICLTKGTVTMFFLLVENECLNAKLYSDFWSNLIPYRIT